MPSLWHILIEIYILEKLVHFGLYFVLHVLSYNHLEIRIAAANHNSRWMSLNIHYGLHGGMWNNKDVTSTIRQKEHAIIYVLMINSSLYCDLTN